MAAVAAAATRHRIMLSAKTSCHSARSLRISPVNKEASGARAKKISNGIKGVIRGILFRRGFELIRALVPKEVFISQIRNTSSPVELVIISAAVSDVKNWLMVSVVFIASK